MDVRAVREALRLLRLQSGKSVRGIRGLDKSTVHRIENIKKDPDYSPELASALVIIEECGTTPSAFFTKLDGLQRRFDDASVRDLFVALQDEQTVQQVLAFLDLPAPARVALTLARDTIAPTPTRPPAPIRGPKGARRTKPRKAPRRSSGHESTDR